MQIIGVNESSGIPLFGLDFIGILDRGTNLIEVKPITICNLRCRYCFVQSGEYLNNFIVDSDYMVKWLKKAITLKEHNLNTAATYNKNLKKGSLKDYEVHIAPYGEFFLYDEYERLIKSIRGIQEVKTISIQTNGQLITPQKIEILEKAGLSRLNISFNTFDKEQAVYLSGSQGYSVESMLDLFERVLESSMELLIAPIWFFGYNDEQIIKIIEFVKGYEKKGYSWPKLRLGVQNYLIYKTGRHLKKIRQRDFMYFYSRLAKLEKKYEIKLKLGPHDFNIHKGGHLNPPFRKNDIIKARIICQARFPNEYIAIYENNAPHFNEINEVIWAIKVLSKNPLKENSLVKIKIIKGSNRENLMTGVVL
ncbi:MAG: radical SAM protein [Promethearchaeota archaeon]